MSFAWREFLQVARDLDAGVAPTCSADARHRATIGRAYYASFCPARDFLIERGLISPQHGDERGNLHVNVMRAFVTASSGRWKKIGEWLDAMRKDRHRADYEAEVPGLPERARKALLYAGWTLAELEKLRAE